MFLAPLLLCGRGVAPLGLVRLFPAAVARRRGVASAQPPPSRVPEDLPQASEALFRKSPANCSLPQVIPYLSVVGGKRALELYQRALGATVEAESFTEDGKLIHGRLRFGDAVVMVSDEFGPPTPPAGVTVHLWTEDADALWARMTDAGFEAVFPLSDTFWGDRYGQLRDPFGHSWSIAHRVEALTDAEIERRGKAFFANMAAAAPDEGTK